MELYIVKNWLNKVDITIENKLRSTKLIEKLFNVSIYKDNKGKPYLLNDNRFINWSHNNDYLVVGFCEENIGLDIEFNKLIYKDIYEWILSEEEIQLINEDSEKFSSIWTKKESILKFTGDGLVNDLTKVNTVTSSYSFYEYFYNNIIINICSKNKKNNIIISIL